MNAPTGQPVPATRPRTVRPGDLLYLDHRQHRWLQYTRSWALFWGLAAIALAANPARTRPWLSAALLTVCWAALMVTPWLRTGDWLLTRHLRTDRLVTLLPRGAALIGFLEYAVRFPAMAWLLGVPLGTLLVDYLVYGRPAALPAIRLRGRRVSTETIILQHPRTQHRVVLLAVSSLGTVHYYQQLTRRLLAYRSAGAEVHYEGIRMPSPERMASATAVEQLLVASIGVAQQTPADGLKAIGLEDASAALVIPYTASNVDVDALDVARSGAANTFIRRLTARRTATAGPVMAVLRHFRTSAMIARLAGFFTPGRAAYARLLKDRRNRALAAVDQHLANAETATTLVLAWGPGHLPHFARALAGVGFRVERSEWAEVLDISTVTNRDSGTGTITPVISSAITGTD